MRRIPKNTIAAEYASVYHAPGAPNEIAIVPRREDGSPGTTLNGNHRRAANQSVSGPPAFHEYTNVKIARESASVSQNTGPRSAWIAIPERRKNSSGASRPII